MSWDETFIVLNNWGNIFRRKSHRIPFEQRPIEDRCRVQILSGHHAYYGIHRLVPERAPRYLTFVRDPADRCLSMYNFRRSRGDIESDFSCWYEEVYNIHHKNAMVQFFAERLMNTPLPPNHTANLILARKLLDHCWYVGITEYLDQDLKYLFGAMGLPTVWQNHRVAGRDDNALEGLSTHPAHGEVIHKYVDINEEIRQQIYADHPEDVLLYQYALQLHETINGALAQPDNRKV